MSTRCQVRVTDGEDKLTLYHHYDGYPSNMLMLIKQAWEKYGQGWEGARVGKVAGMLCAVDVPVFEPEDGHKLHGDIEWFYEINCKGEMHVGSKPIWKITTYKTEFDFSPKGKLLPDKQRLTKIITLAVDAITEDTAKKVENKGQKEEGGI